MIFFWLKSIIKFSITFIIVILMISLCLFDSPSYAGCHHVGICEFLEIDCISEKYREIAKINLHNLTFINKNHILLDVLKRHINPYTNYQNIYYLHIGKILINQIHSFYQNLFVPSAKRNKTKTSCIIRSWNHLSPDFLKAI